jgi:3-hydroxy-9,10-secoandrosta-1,3,5(10)-triene-9,17-dione monooxygenase reductase component
MATQTEDEAKRYRRALGGFATGVVLVTTEAAGKMAAITINSFTSVSLNPRLVLWCLADNSDRYAIFAEAETWNLHVLGAEEQAMASRFAARGSHDAVDLAHLFTPAEAVKAHSLTSLACKTWARHTMGDHLVLVGEVEHYDTSQGDALTFYNGRYGRAELPQP